MQSDRAQTQPSRDYRVALVVPALVGTLFSILLVMDLRSDRTGLSGGTRLAVTKSATGDVKRRASDRFRWFDVATGGVLYENDSVRTAKNSTATLTFDDGTRI